MRPPLTHLDKKETLPLLALFLLGLLLRVGHAAPWHLWDDSLFYILQARAFLEGEFSFHFIQGEPHALPPLYPLTIAFFSLIFSSMENAATASAVFFGTLLIIPVFLLARRLFGTTPAWIAAFFITLDPLLLNFSIMPMTESLFTGIVMLAALWGWSLRERTSVSSPFLLGILLGSAYLTRVIGIVVIALPLICLAVQLRWRRPDRKTLQAIGGLLAGWLILVVPYWTMLYLEFGKWTLSGFYGDVAANLTRGFAPSEIFHPTGILVAFLTKYIGSVKLFASMYFSTISPLVTVLAVWGVIVAWRRKTSRGASYLLLWTLLLFFATAFFPPSVLDNYVRYLVPLTPFLIILAAQGVHGLYDVAAGKMGGPLFSSLKWTRYLPLAGIILLVSASFTLEAQKTRSYGWPFQWFSASRESIAYFSELRDNGQRLGAVLSPDSGVMARKPHVPYFAGTHWFPLPVSASIEDIDRLERTGAQYLYLDRTTIGRTPRLDLLLNPQERLPRLVPQVWQKDPETNRYRTVLFRVLEPTR
ncbi:MAG: glycosyltransferase family 39 protein [Nitrospirae bacterium]|nr:glycosyltransferase family 39 protein [Nitrospirota bacterium]